MSTSDLFPRVPGAPSKAPDPTGEPPQVVPPPSALGLLAFPSEAGDDEPPPPDDRPPPPSRPATTVSAPVSISQPVAEFEVRPLDQFHVDVASFVAPSSSPRVSNEEGLESLAKVLERPGGLSWGEAVEIAANLCQALQDSPTPVPMHIEPRLVLITPTNEVRLLPGQPGGDPLVMQVGRLLRAMLVGKDVPSELRLLLSQATFELPIFTSVDDLAQALRQVADSTPTADAATALVPASKAPMAHTTYEKPPRALRPILPPSVRGSKAARARVFFNTDALLVSAILVAAAIIGGLLMSRSNSRVDVRPVASSSESPASPASATAPPAPATAPPAEGTSGIPPLNGQPAAAEPRASAPEAVRPVEGSRTVAPRPDKIKYHVLTAGTPPAPPKPVRSESTGASTLAARDSERRAAALIADGQAEEASMVFDGLIMANPLYEPKASDLTPEALATFRASRKLLLPTIALRDYDRAKRALTAGDPDRALALGHQVSAILNHLDTDPSPTLRGNVQELVEKATAAKLAVDEVVYSAKDPGVVPARPLSRQFPATGPIGVPPNRVGVLEMVIGKQGDVEFVKLYTPLNRYHERMVVSAAKAWRYVPATKNGRPVRFKLTVTINLPESGTDNL
jgi:hypothetical protein